MYQQRGAADKIDINISKITQRLNAAQARNTDHAANQQTEGNAHRRNLYGNSGTGQQKRKRICHKLKIHILPIPSKFLVAGWREPMLIFSLQTI